MDYTELTKQAAEAVDHLLASAIYRKGDIFIIGCSSDSTAPEVSPESYRGPSISLDSTGEFHTILVQSPSPGYLVLVERVEENRGFDEAFVTIRMPNPRHIWAR